MLYILKAKPISSLNRNRHTHKRHMPPKLSFGGMCGNLQVIPLDKPRMKLLSDTELLLCDYGTVAVDLGLLNLYPAARGNKFIKL